MARQALGALTTMNTSTHLDAMLIELYALRELITDPSYTGSTPKLTFSAGYNLGLGGAPDSGGFGGTWKVFEVAAGGGTGAAVQLSATGTGSGQVLGSYAFISAGSSAGDKVGASIRAMRANATTSSAASLLEVFTNNGSSNTLAARIDESQNVLVVGPGALGYGSGAGGTVLQATSKSTGVTLNKATGQITLNAASLAANTAVAFTLTNSLIGANDMLHVQRISGGTAGAYQVWADSSAAGSAVIYVLNRTGGALAEAVVLQFAVIKGATS